ncbi:predicted protein [Lichtheimia corymbifera JMRC:FSU:9682]|uniref:Uncharacterized protein n=1 Tax=Lichtheimia corymbifera JMRC:FSU:9682 TaxID=1263082 RepID=A0A068RV44_9FUNG|nr:predicted protein [Lichtheimia corymbifera JMRC:FSU:9682]
MDHVINKQPGPILTSLVLPRSSMHLSKVATNIAVSYQQQARRSNEQQSLYLRVNTIYSILWWFALLANCFQEHSTAHVSYGCLSIAQGVRRQVSVPFFGDLLQQHIMDGMEIWFLYEGRELLRSTTRIEKAFHWLCHWHVKDVISSSLCDPSVMYSHHHPRHGQNPPSRNKLHHTSVLSSLQSAHPNIRFFPNRCISRIVATHCTSQTISCE